ncbi:MAG: di-heme oxidoredictase family protein [Bacteroidota bacterium]
MKYPFAILVWCLSLLLACKEEVPSEPSLLPEASEELLGGQTTIFDQSRNAFGFQAPGVNGHDELLFFVGNSFFNQNWVTSPASTTARDGLGPFFNARSCAACHFKDGRGQPPTSSGAIAEGLLLRLSIPGTGPRGEPLPEPNYGDQLQDQSVLEAPREGGYEIQYMEIPGSYPDGHSYSLRSPSYEFVELAYGGMSPMVQISPRVGQQIIGLGLLEAVPEETILGMSDPDDTDNDGISGKPNLVWEVESQSHVLGRFGWKANQPSLLQQTAAAFHGDIGITTPLFSEENCLPNRPCDSLPNGGNPEIPLDDLQKVVLYVSTLAVPARRNWEEQDVLKGKQLFAQIGCTSCHIPELKTGTHARFEALSHQTIRPYTDLLLHDMGEGLADNRPDFDASGQEWRTPPLWGIGLFPTVNGHSFYLHDGRARNLEEAILWHGGEAGASRRRFKELSIIERNQVIQFLESL